MKTVVLCVIAIAAALVPMPAALVERAYTATVYESLQPLLTSMSNRVPFALLDAAIAAVVVAWIVCAVRDRARRGWARAAIAAVRRTLAWGAVAYLAFLVLWGFNYRREPLVSRLQFDRGAITGAAVLRTARLSVDRVNALAVPAHALGWAEPGDIDPALADGLDLALGELGLVPPVVARPKRTLLDLYFRRAGVEGMTDPYFLETLVVGDLEPFERPLVVAHEWSHLAGLADESEANFAGWLACLRGSPADQYSGWMFLYGELAGVLERADRTALAAKLGPVPRADLAAARARVRRNVRPAVADVAWRAYDSYLRSNRVAAGTRSYDEVVQLVLGVRFDDAWRPLRR